MKVDCKVSATNLLFGFHHHRHHHHHHHHHKHQGLDPLIRSVSTVTAARANASSVSQLFSFLAVCSGMISNGFGFVAFVWFCGIVLTVCYLLSVVHNSAVQRLGYATINKAACFNPFGVIFRFEQLSCVRRTLNNNRPTWFHSLYYFTIYCSTCFEC